MANWSLHQEQLVDKPVYKRAKHGIHFKDGKSITAHFSGKPCHYFDGKLWKPIDTKPVLRKDGWFGCPHSDVIIHPDGTVKVGDYVQKASLISASEGKVDGDRIARPFSGGVQYLYITEDGFRQEIVLEKMPDLKQASALLDTVSGVLPTKYKASALSVKDSATAKLADSVVLADAKGLAEYLEKAVYPVVIDPDFTQTGATAETSLKQGKPTFVFTGVAGDTGGYSTHATGEKCLMRFDLSSIAAAATASAASLKVTKTAGSDATRPRAVNIHKILDANGDWTQGTNNDSLAQSGDACWNAKVADGSGGVTTAWAGSAGMATADTDYVSTVLATTNFDRADSNGTQYTFTFNASGLTVLQDWFGDITNNGLMLTSAAASYIYIASKAYATESYRPVLTVTYTEAAAGNPWNYYAQQ